MRLASRLSLIAAAVVIAGIPAAAAAAASVSPTGQNATSAAPATIRNAPPPAEAKSGTQLWLARYNDGLGTGSAGLAVATSPAGSAVFVAGDVVRAGSRQTAAEVVAYNPTTGAELWHARFNPGGSGTAAFDAIAVSPGSSAVFVTGTTQPTSASHVLFLTAAFSATTGATLWLHSTGLAGAGNAITVSPSGSTVFVGGTTGNGGPTTVAYNATTGAPQWTTNAGTTSFDISIAVSADGSKVFVTGDEPPPGGAVSAAYSAATGATLCTHPLTFDARALALSPDGSKVFLTGFNGSRGMTQALDASTGSMLWARTVQSAQGAGDQALAVSPDGSTVFASGYTSTATIDFEYSTVAYNAATGAVRWAAKGPTGQVVAVAVSPDGSKVFVTGNTDLSPTTNGWGTVARSASTGARLWIARGLAGSAALALVVSPGGSEVFVTGEIPPTGPTVGGDMGTAAYSA